MTGKDVEVFRICTFASVNCMTLFPKGGEGQR